MKQILLHNLSIPFIHEPAESYQFTQNGLFFANTGDAVVLHAEPDSVWLEYMQQLDIVPIQYIQIVSRQKPEFNSVFADEIVHQQVSDFVSSQNEQVILDVFMPTGYESFFAQKHRLHYLAQSHQYENYVSKSDFRIHAANLHIPIVPGVAHVSRAYLRSVVLKEFEQGATALVVKQDDGVSGTASAIFLKSGQYTSYVPVSNVPHNFGRGFVVEHWLTECTYSPSVQCVVSLTGNVEILSVHNQIFRHDHISFLGNQSVSVLPKEVVDISKRYAQIFGSYLALNGFVGFFGIDTIVSSENTVFAVELNPRRTIPSYTFQIIKRLGFTEETLPPYVSFTVQSAYWQKSTKVIFKQLEHLLYSKEKGSGIIPINLTLAKVNGKITFLCIAQNAIEIEALQTQLLHYS